MAGEAAAIIIEIVIAIGSLLASTAVSEEQMKSSEGRTARETFVRSVYQAVKDRYNISLDQLNQVAEKLGIKLSQLAEATRGSARLSAASKMLREFTSEYPQLVNSINNAKDIIQNEVNNLTSKENAAASKIESRNDVSNQTILNDAVGSISTVNNALNDLSSAAGGGKNNIDTTLISKQIVNDKTEQQARDENAAQDQGSGFRQSGEEPPAYGTNEFWKWIGKPEIKTKP